LRDRRGQRDGAEALADVYFSMVKRLAAIGALLRTRCAVARRAAFEADSERHAQIACPDPAQITAQTRAAQSGATCPDVSEDLGRCTLPRRCPDGVLIHSGQRLGKCACPDDAQTPPACCCVSSGQLIWAARMPRWAAQMPRSVWAGHLGSVWAPIWATSRPSAASASAPSRCPRRSRKAAIEPIHV
jgi:hypothetical protein